MTCKKCGAQLEEGQKFCSHCGAAQNAAPDQPRPDPTGNLDRNTLNLVLKILAAVGAIVFGIRAIVSLVQIFTGLFSTISSIGYFGIFGFIRTLLLYPVMSVLFTVVNAAICIALLCFALRKDDSSNDHLFLGLCTGGAALIAVQLVQSLLRVILNLSVLRYVIGGAFSAIIGAIVWAAIPVAVIYLLLYLMGKTPLLGKTVQDIKDMVGSILPAVTATLSAVKNRAEGQANERANAQTQAQPYAQTAPPTYTPPAAGQAAPLKTDRGLLMYIVLTIITCGIYSYYFLYAMARDVNIACEGDGKNTGGLLAFILLSFITCGFYALYWYYSLGNRLAANAPRYGLSFQENGTTVLLWYLVGALLCGIGPYVAMHFLMKNTNAICDAYNRTHGLY